MTAKASNWWINVLQHMVSSYNHIRNRNIGMAPADVRKTHKNRFWVRLYGDGDTIRKRVKPLIDDTMVLINLAKWSFDKGYFGQLDA